MAMILSEACNSPFRLNDRHKDHVPEIPNDPKKLGPNTAPKQADQKDVERRYKTRYGPGYFAAIPDDDPDEEGEEVGLDLGDQGIDPEIDWAEDESGEEEEDFQYRVRLDEGKLRFSRRYEDNAYRVTAEEGLRLKISRKGKEGDGQWILLRAYCCKASLYFTPLLRHFYASFITPLLRQFLFEPVWFFMYWSCYYLKKMIAVDMIFVSKSEWKGKGDIEKAWRRESFDIFPDCTVWFQLRQKSHDYWNGLRQA